MPDLLEAARLARSQAYAPYSGYRVGAALLDGDGRIWAGCNVENIVYPLGMCAERNAIAAMVAGGGESIQEILLFTPDGGTPCGACLQVMGEFAPDPERVVVKCVDEAGNAKAYILRELFPYGFRSNIVNRTEP